MRDETYIRGNHYIIAECYKFRVGREIARLEHQPVAYGMKQVLVPIYVTSSLSAGWQQHKVGIFSKWRKIEVVKWAEDAIYAPIQTVDDKNHSLR